MHMHIDMHPTTYADQMAIMICGSLRLTAGDRYLLKKGCLSVLKQQGEVMFTMKFSTVRVLSRRGSLAMMKYLNGQHFICSLPYFFLGYLSCCELNLLNAD